MRKSAIRPGIARGHTAWLHLLVAGMGGGFVVFVLVALYANSAGGLSQSATACTPNTPPLAAAQDLSPVAAHSQAVENTPQLGHDVLTPFEAGKTANLQPYDHHDLMYPKILRGRFLNRDLSKIRRNCVMGVAGGYSRQKIYPFLNSLRASGYTDDIIMGVFHDAPSGVRKAFEEFDVIVYELPSAAREYQNRHHPEKIHNLIAIHRYAFYREWIWPYRGEDRFIIHADVRDTYFQSNPFDEVDHYFPPGVNLHVFEEGRKETVGGVKEFWNRDKIMQSYGQFVMDYLQDKPILCSGVTVARANAMYRYVTLIANEAVMRNFTKDDQGYHILMYYVGRLDPLGVRAFRLGEGLVATMTYIDHIVRDSEGFVLIGDPVVNRQRVDPSDTATLRSMYRAPIVHQYDRFKDLELFVHKKYNVKR